MGTEDWEKLMENEEFKKWSELMQENDLEGLIKEGFISEKDIDINDLNSIVNQISKESSSENNNWIRKLWPQNRDFFSFSKENKVDLRNLIQYTTYQIFFNNQGIPTHNLNRNIIESALNRARLENFNKDPILIEPFEEKYTCDFPIGPNDYTEILPPVITIANIYKYSREKGDISTVYIWFQDSFGLDIPEKVMEKLSKII